MFDLLASCEKLGSNDDITRQSSQSLLQYPAGSSEEVTPDPVIQRTDKSEIEKGRSSKAQFAKRTRSSSASSAPKDSARWLADRRYRWQDYFN